MKMFERKVRVPRKGGRVGGPSSKAGHMASLTPATGRTRVPEARS
jgi:hypothetical protein